MNHAVRPDIVILSSVRHDELRCWNVLSKDVQPENPRPIPYDFTLTLGLEDWTRVGP